MRNWHYLCLWWASTEILEFRANLAQIRVVRVANVLVGALHRRAEPRKGPVDGLMTLNRPLARLGSPRILTILFRWRLPMAIKNLVTVMQCAANLGVRVTGMRQVSMQAGGIQRPFLSLPRPACAAQAEPFPYGTDLDNRGVLRAGRSARHTGVVPGARSSVASQCKSTALTATATPTWPTTTLVLG